MAETSSANPKWYICKQASGVCLIISADDAEQKSALESWGPFATQNEAIARRVGLIRAGKCLPA